jgi:4-hydroxybenzoate polyprenyltransferase
LLNGDGSEFGLRPSSNSPNEVDALGPTGEASNVIRRSPIIVDLDGTLTPTDTLVESVIQLVKKSPLNLLRLPFWLAAGRGAFKEAVASKSRIAVELLPYREPLLAYLREEKEKGRLIILATAAHKTIAQRVSTHLGLFDDVLATDEDHNLKGSAKLEAIQERVGRDFVYAGDGKADIPIWKAAKRAILVGTSAGLADFVRREVPIEREFPKERFGLAVWVRALRVHQWSKNLLLFVPLLTAFSFLDVGKLSKMAIAFLAFSMSASATYVVNDLWDLESDRAHPRKLRRPFASAKIPILRGIAVAVFTLSLGFFLALSVSRGFVLMLLLYLVLTSTYSFMLKRYVLIDVLVLAILYTLRILAGSLASEVSTSSWLLAFSVFMFLSLALVKRCAELVSLSQNEKKATRGRDYRVTDLMVLWPLGIGAGVSAVVIFGLFISAPETQARYATPQLLWLVAIGLIYWIARLWVKTSRGEMHDDPIIYAIKDYGSRVVIIAMTTTMIVAHLFTLTFP